MPAVTICSDFVAQKNKVCHYFHCFPIYLPWSDGTRWILVFWMLSFKPTSSKDSLHPTAERKGKCPPVPPLTEKYPRMFGRGADCPSGWAILIKTISTASLTGLSDKQRKAERRKTALLRTGLIDLTFKKIHYHLLLNLNLTMSS